MDFLTKVAIKLMPVIHNPLFKTGCYLIAVITIVTLIYLYKMNKKKEKEALKKKEITDVSHPLTAAVSIIFFISLSVGVLADITEWNEPGKITVLDNGKVIKESKPYFSIGTKKSTVYDQTPEFTSSVEKGKKEPVKIKFSDSGNAETDYKFAMSLPEDPGDIKKIHKIYGSQEKLMLTGAKPIVRDAIKLGAELLSSEVCAEEKEKKLLAFIKDQLKEGFYVVKEGKIRKDEKGRIIRKPHPFLDLKVKFENIELANFNKEKIVKELEIEKEKIKIELKKIEGLKLDPLPFVNELQQKIEINIINNKKMSKDQKELIINSIRNAKKIILKLKERENKPKKIKEEKRKLLKPAVFNPTV